MSDTVKETKAQRVERLKRELNPWEAHAEIERFAREGWDSVPPEWLGTYFRWWGIYTQGDGVGAVGGKGGEGKAVRHFMVRIRIPNGVIESSQLRTIADLAEWHGRGVADITVRQNFQLHWVTLDALPEVFRALWLQGVTSMGSCGDVTRNVTGCPVAGLDADELIDASPIVLEATRMLNGNPVFYNLPRKFKVSISGCRAWCTYPEINDIGLTATRHPAGEIGYTVRVGGGLSTDPHLGVRLDAFVPPARALAVVRAIAEIFRESDVLRQNRERARVKFLFLHHGWTADRFLAAIEERLGSPLPRGVPEDAPDDAYRDHVGIHPQRAPGTCYVGVAVLRGRLSAEQMRVAAKLADRYGTGALRTTSMQNLVIPNVPTGRAGALVRELEAADFVLDASPFRRGTVACTGTEVLQAGAHRDQGLRPRPRGGARTAAARVRAASADQRDRLSEQLRPALDRRPRPRGQEDQDRRRARGRLLLLRGRRGRPPSGGGAAHRSPAAGDRGGAGDRAAPAHLPRRAAAERELPPVHRAPHRRRAARPARRRAGRSGGA